MDHIATLDPSVETFLAAHHRLSIIRLSPDSVQDSPAIRIAGRNSGSTTVCAHGVPLDVLDRACAAFNAVIAGDTAPPDPMAERRRRNRAADAIGDRVRELVLESGL